MSSDFPVTTHCIDSTLNGETDAFLVKLNSDASDILYSTFLGGAGDDNIRDVIISSSGNVVLVGHTTSSNFPVTLNAHDMSCNGHTEDYGGDIFLTVFNPNTRTMDYSTFIGGSGSEVCHSIQQMNSNFILCGHTFSADFPITSNAYDETYNGQGDAFVLSFNLEANTIAYATYLGGSKNEGYPIGKISNGIVYVGSSTNSSDYPTTGRLMDFNANGTFYLTRLNMDAPISNHPPVLTHPIPDTTIVINKSFVFNLPDNLFADEDELDVLTMSVTANNRADFPMGWLNYNSDQKRFQGTPQDIDTLTIKITVVDNHHDTVSDEFIITVVKNLTAIEQNKNMHAELYSLRYNYPNPFNPTTVIGYQLQVAGNVKLLIYNSQGQIIKTLQNGFQAAGEHSLVWDARDEKNNSVSSGIYFCQMIINDQILQRKMALVR